MYIDENKIQCCHLMLNSPATRWHLGFHFFLFNEAMLGKHQEEDVGPGLQSNSSNCLVLILHRQLGTICSVLGRATANLPNIYKTLYQSMFDTYQNTYSLRPTTACCTES